MIRIANILNILIFLCICSASISQNVVIKGTAPSYANQELIFHRYSNVVTYEEEEIGRCLVDENGSFKLSFNIERITFIFSHLGIYKAFIYTEPDKEYEIILPERMEKSQEEKLNPYFTESRIQLGIADYDTDEINFLIRMFNDAYTPFYNKHVLNFINDNDFSELDDDIENMEKPFMDSTNKFFNNYRKYRYGLLKFLAFQKKAKSTQEDYFKDKPVLYDNPAYMELVNQVYDKYFIFSGRTGKGKEIYHAVNNSKSYRELKNILSENKVLHNDTILELVILNEIFNEFYDNNFSRSGLLSILDTLVLQTDIHRHKLTGSIIKNKLTKLLPGYAPPDFKLFDTDSNIITLNDFEGRYVYLNFCMCYSYTCLSEFEILNGIFERQRENLEIITIAVDPDPQTLKDFAEKNNYEWKFLHFGNHPRVLKEYDIRAYPTFYLIGPEGKLLVSPAPAPSEDFESRLIKILKNRGKL